VRPSRLLLFLIALLIPAAPASAAVSHTVQPGETLWSIAAANNLTTRTVAAYNGLSESAQVVLGSTIMVPSTTEGFASLQNVGLASSAPAAAPAATGGSYTVQVGDTLSALAARAGVSASALAANNGLDPAGLHHVWHGRRRRRGRDQQDDKEQRETAGAHVRDLRGPDSLVIVTPTQHSGNQSERDYGVLQPAVHGMLRALQAADLKLWAQKWRWYERNTLPWNRARIHYEFARRRAFCRWPVHGNVLEMLREGRLELGEHVLLEPGVWLTAAAPARIRIGGGTFLNLGVQVAAVELVEIGEHCMLANGCFVTDANHRFDDPDKPVPWQGFTSKGPTRVGSNVWFGANVVVTSGVTIGDRCVIGANSVVTTDVPPHSIAAGVPARVIRAVRPSTA